MNILVQYGFTDRIGGLFSFHFPPPSLADPARVIRADRGRVLIASEHGILHLDTGDVFVTGDWVAVTDAGDARDHGRPAPLIRASAQTRVRSAVRRAGPRREHPT